MSDCRVTQASYDARAEEEDQRLHLHPIEYYVTVDTLERYLPLPLQSNADSRPSAPSTPSSASVRKRKIADIGGATGTYAFFLAERGEEVHLRDLSPALIEIASARNAKKQACDKEDSTANDSTALASIQVGNALDALSLFPANEAGTFDAVLLLGPLYHLIEANERKVALQNALSLLKPTGVLFAAFVSRNAHLRDLAMKDPGRLVRESEFYTRYLQTGQYVRRGDRNVESYHATLSEIEPTVQSAGGRVVEIIGTEGILGGGLDKQLVGASRDVVQSWANIMRDLGRKPENLGNADHWLVVIEKDKERNTTAVNV